MLDPNRYESSEILTEYFFNLVETKFQFLVKEYKYIESIRLITYGLNEKEFTSTDANKKSIYSNIFKRYENEEFEIIVSYGDRESIVELKYLSKSIESIFGIWEIFKANNIDHELVADSQFVLNSRFMQSTINNMANELKANIDYIFPVNENIHRTLLNNRIKVQKEFEQRTRRNHIKEAVNKAAEEFRSKNYKEVIKILEEYKNELSEAALKKLEYSKKKVR